jgi:hypothetical protein
MPAAYVKAHDEANEDGLTNNYDDLKMITKTLNSLLLFGHADVDEWITAWGSTAATQKGFNMRVGCVSEEYWDGATHIAVSAFAAASVIATLI